MKKALLLEATASSLEEAKSAIESSVGLSLAAHESAYHGGEYFRGDLYGANLILQANFIEDDGEPAEADFPGADLLVYLDGEIGAVDWAASRLMALSKVLRSSTY
ncbi:hypothetical protein [Achromobacter sp. MFA1 R4]|uniref:hypothetical protein n=1 Tax=Achromobacter sp. MFA1 R4 TaxID=1881016 RepID=UPI0012EB0E08|nr:hypothetical protein [Achromobacter sp. MFA1 R4]